MPVHNIMKKTPLKGGDCPFCLPFKPAPGMVEKLFRTFMKNNGKCPTYFCRRKV